MSAFALRRSVRTTFVLIIGLLSSLIFVATSATPAQAAPAITCGVNSTYGVAQATGVLTKYNPTTGAATANGDLNGDAAGQAINALALPTNGGNVIYAIDRTNNQVIEYDVVAESAVRFPANITASEQNGLVAGGVNPINGNFYYASSASGTAGQWTLYMFNPTTQQSGRVATVSGPNGVLAGNGDLAFDVAGNMYIVSNSSATAAGALGVVEGPLPSTIGSNPTVPLTKISDTPANAGQYNSMSFDETGALVIGATARILRVAPSTGEVLTDVTSPVTFSDFASCTPANALRAQKNLPDGRQRAGDQFTMTINRADGAPIRNNTATTAGDDSGLQDTLAETAGVVPGRDGVRFLITETGAGATSLTRYATTWRCGDLANNNAEISSGSGAVADVTVPQGNTASNVLCIFTNEPRNPSLTLQKSADPEQVSAAGDEVTYSFEVENTGNVPLTDLVINEGDFSGTGDLSAIDCPVTSLAVGEVTTCTATYAVTQADIDAGSVTNTATATGTPPGGGDPVTTPPSTAVVTADPDPELTLTKSADPTQVANAGDEVTYSFEVENTGNVTISDLVINEGDFTGTGDISAISCPVTTLAPDAVTTCTATYAVTQADIDAGSVTNTATATGTPPGGGDPVTTPPSTAVVTAGPDPELTLTKTADPTQVGSVGDEVTYSFEVENTGNVTITDLVIDEGDFTGTGDISAISCPVTTLAPDAITTCTATYVVTQADIDAGSITNTATATGNPPGGGDPVTTPPSTAVVDADPDPELTLTKTVDPTQVANAGDEVTYSFEVENTGNVTITDLVINEGDFTGTGDISAIECPETTLAPDAITTCTATYTVTQADIDAGSVTNTATATGNPPGGGDPVTTPPSTAVVDADPDPELTLTKTADPTQVANAGDTVTYSFEVENTGNVTITDLVIDEGDFTGTGDISAIECPETTLAPDAITTCTATYTVTQADIDAGSITNTATATGNPPGGGDPVTTPPSTAVVTADPAPELTLTKTADPTQVANAGDTVTYSFEVENTGNVTITDLVIDEGDFTGTGDISAIECPETTLAPDAITTCTATYTVTQADIDAGSVTNTATATGNPPGDGDPVTTRPSTAVVTADPAPELTLTKTADPTQVANAGDEVTYSFEVENTGNVTITDLVIEEGDFTGTGDISAIECPETTLAPDAITTCTATYTVTQADIDAGSVTNTATATGNPPGGGDPVTTPPSTAVVTADPAPELTLTKTADPAQVANAGDTVTYSFEVENTGNVTITDLVIDEGDFTGTGDISAITCPETTLAPDAITTCTASYTVTQADIDAGSVTNTATATGNPPGGGDPITTPPSTSVVTSDPTPGLSLVKTSDTEKATKVGQVITYSFEVTNTGNVTLTDVAVDEGEFSGTGTLSAVECPETTLAPKDSVTCTATYRVTAADLKAGSITNVATATGNPPGGGDPVITPPSEVKVVTVEPPTTSPSGILPNTGGPVMIGAYVALAMLVLGCALVVVRRREDVS